MTDFWRLSVEEREAAGLAADAAELEVIRHDAAVLAREEARED